MTEKSDPLTPETFCDKCGLDPDNQVQFAIGTFLSKLHSVVQDWWHSDDEASHVKCSDRLRGLCLGVATGKVFVSAGKLPCGYLAIHTEPNIYLLFDPAPDSLSIHGLFAHGYGKGELEFINLSGSYDQMMMVHSLFKALEQAAIPILLRNAKGYGNVH